MKKIITIFFLVIYSLTTVGATIHAHYCMGEYIGSGIYHNTKEKCGKCGMTKAKSKGCCKDEHKYISLKREHNQIKASIEIPACFTEAISSDYITYYVGSIAYSEATADYSIHPPPLIHKQRLHLLNCVFLI